MSTNSSESSTKTAGLVPTKPDLGALTSVGGTRPAHEIAPGVFHIDTYPFNWYVVEEAGRLTLIDSGWPGHERALYEGLASIGRSAKDIEAILLTHAHSDHVGMAGPLSRAHKIPVFIHPADKAMVEGVLQLPWYGLLTNAWRPHMAFNMLGHAIWNGLLSERGIQDTHPLTDGGMLDVPGKPRVIHVPGHTPGEVVFVLESRGIVLTGDTLVTEDLRSGVPGGPQFPCITLNGEDDVARRSADKMRELGKMTLLPGHGKPWVGNVADAVAEAQAIRS